MSLADLKLTIKDLSKSPTPKGRRILREIDENSDSSDKDRVRVEEEWTSDHEDYFNSIVSECKSIGNLMTKIMKKNKIYYKVFSLPTIILPLSLSVVDKYFTQDNDFIRVALLLLTGSLTAVNTFLNFGKKVSLYNEYSAKYNELALIIETMLIKRKRFRIDCDVFTEQIKNQYLNLNSSAPDT